MVEPITEEEMLKKVEQLCIEVIHRMIYGPSREEEQMIKDKFFKEPYYTLSSPVKDHNDVRERSLTNSYDDKVK